MLNQEAEEIDEIISSDEEESRGEFLCQVSGGHGPLNLSSLENFDEAAEKWFNGPDDKFHPDFIQTFFKKSPEEWNNLTDLERASLIKSLLYSHTEDSMEAFRETAMDGLEDESESQNATIGSTLSAEDDEIILDKMKSSLLISSIPDSHKINDIKINHLESLSKQEKMRFDEYMNVFSTIFNDTLLTDTLKKNRPEEEVKNLVVITVDLARGEKVTLADLANRNLCKLSADERGMAELIYCPLDIARRCMKILFEDTKSFKDYCLSRRIVIPKYDD